MNESKDCFETMDRAEGVLPRKAFHNTEMPPTKDQNTKQSFRSFSNNGMTMSAKVYHPATNLMPPTPPQSPTGVAPSFPNRNTTSTWGRQNSNNGKYS